MDWVSITAAPEKISLVRAIVSLVPSYGVGRRALEEASTACGDDGLWPRYFPEGPTEALWFISEVSDASMAAVYRNRLASGLPDVVATRFAQNTDLKSFVRRVMLYDFVHPLQALSRMQRTARQMDSCRLRRSAAGTIRLMLINLLYTAAVMVWLADRSRDNRLTLRFSSVALGWL